jgi:hypothetical protein
MYDEEYYAEEEPPPVFSKGPLLEVVIPCLQVPLQDKDKKGEVRILACKVICEV